MNTSSPQYPSDNGDLIIQTSDGVLFGVHTLLLRLSSSVMNDMLVVGSGSGDRETGGFARSGLCGCISLVHCEPVTIMEDSTVFRALLSFIYPDSIPTIFTRLTSLMPVLDAAAKYDMKAIIHSLSLQLMRGITGEPLLYEDPLWVYSKVKQLDLTDLARAAANATLTIDLGKAPIRPEVANVPASWILELVKLRTKRTQWWKDECQNPIPIANMDRQYEPTETGSSFYEMITARRAFYRQTPCQCPQMNSACEIIPPMKLVMKIIERPCARSVREIDFNRFTQCLRCGAAATAHYRKICLLYEEEFGKF